MQLQINQEKKELKPHGNYGFPLLVSYERLSYFETGSFLWHWHPEVELTLVMDGEIAYQVNDNSGLGTYTVPKSQAPRNSSAHRT